MAPVEMLIRLSSFERVEISPPPPYLPSCPPASKVEHKDKIRLTAYKNRVPQPRPHRRNSKETDV